MDKKSTLSQHQQKTSEQKNDPARAYWSSVRFLQDYCRAFVSVRTAQGGAFPVWLN